MYTVQWLLVFLVCCYSSCFYANAFPKNAQQHYKNLCFYNYLSREELCPDHLNLTRAQMPQLGADFLTYLVEHYPQPYSQCQLLPASSVTATQSIIHDTLVIELLTSLKESGQLVPIFVSTDGHVLDGHHRWAALQIMQKEVQAVIIDLPIRHLLELSRQFSEGPHV